MALSWASPCDGSRLSQAAAAVFGAVLSVDSRLISKLLTQLCRRSDNDNWAVPGGAIELGESMVQAAVRETREETGIECEITGLVGIYTDPKHVLLYTSNGEVRQEFSIVLTARATGGEPMRSEESSEVRWVPRVELGGYSMDRSMRLRIGHYLEGRATPYLG